MSQRPRSATEGPAPAGVRFARALAAKDSGGLCGVLAEEVDFQALTPGRHWQATTGKQAVEEIILARWFGAGDDVEGPRITWMRVLCSGYLPAEE